jgi:hypothetical protein
MKSIGGRTFLILAILMLGQSLRSSGQPFETAVQYMDYITKANQQLTEKYLFYLSGASHGKSAKKVEKRRQELLQSISDTRYNIMGMPPFKGDRTLKDTTVAYLKIMNSVFNEDYGKIVNMEEIAEQSYDLMEAYMLAKDKANEKLNEAAKKQQAMQVKFAQKNNITLIDNQSELETKMDIASAVMSHHNEVYLVFFKSYKQEVYLMDALNKKNIVGIEQNLNALQKYSDEGLEKLNGLKGYNGDPSLIESCRNALNFYKEEAAKGTGLTDFILKEENFTKSKKQFDSKPASKRTQQDVDQYNNAVNDINAAGKSYNALNAELNKQRTSVMNNWDKAVAKYMDAYMPTQRK